MYRLLYIFRHTFLVLKGTKKVAFITVVSLLVGMVALGSTYIVGFKLFKSSLSLKEKVKIIVFFKKDLLPEDVNKAVSMISSIEGVKSTLITTPEEAKVEFENLFPQYKEILDSLSKNPLPYSLTVEISDISMGKRISEIIKGIPIVDVVVFSEETASKINELIRVVWLIFISVLLAVLGDLVFTIQNSTTLLLDFRRHDLVALQLIGSDNAFIFLPFIFISILLNLIAFGISAYVLTFVNKMSSTIVQSIIPYATVSTGMNFNLILFEILIFSLFSTLIGSFISLLRFRDVK